MYDGQTIEWGEFSNKHKNYIATAIQSDFNVAEGAIRSGKTIDNCIIAAMYLETCQDKIHLASGSTLPNAKLNVGACNGFGLENLFRGRCRWGKYKDNECLYIQTKTGEKIVVFAGGGKADSYKKILGNSYGMWIATEINEHYDCLDSKSSFVKVAMGRQIAAKRSFILWDLNPSNPNAAIYKDYIDLYEHTYKGKYNYEHFTLNDNATVTPEKKAIIESQYDINSIWYRRDILGQRCVATGLVYQQFADNKEKYIIDTIPEITIAYAGVDFGGTKSGHSFTLTGFTQGFKKMIVLEEYYKKEKISPAQLEQDFVNFILMCKSKYKFYEVNCDSAEQTLIRGFEVATLKNNLGVEVKNALKCPINDRIAFLNSMIAQERFAIYKDCTVTINALESSVYDEKEKVKDIRLDNGTNNQDSIDSLEYTFEKIMNDIMYLGGK